MSASTGTSAPAEERLLTALQTATDRLIHYATRGTAKQVEPPLTEALSEVEGFCAALEAFLAHGFKTRQFLLFTVHPWAFVEHSEKFGELNAEAVRPYTSPMPPYTSLYLPIPPYTSLYLHNIGELSASGSLGASVSLSPSLGSGLSSGLTLAPALASWCLEAP